MTITWDASSLAITTRSDDPLGRRAPNAHSPIRPFDFDLAHR